MDVWIGSQAGTLLHRCGWDAKLTEGGRSLDGDASEDADPSDPRPALAVARLSPVRRLDERGVELGWFDDLHQERNAPRSPEVDPCFLSDPPTWPAPWVATGGV